METYDWIYLVVLVALIFISGFFSASETGMMAVNRYRLKHLAKRNKAAQRTLELLKTPDKLLTTILIGNTFANILASAIASLLSIKFLGTYGIYISTIVLTIIILIFAEATPKTFAALYPEKIALGFSLALKILLKILYPLVYLCTAIGNSLLRLSRSHAHNHHNREKLSYDELLTLVSGKEISLHSSHQEMLVQLLELQNMTIEDVMVPRNEIMALDLNDSIEIIKDKLSHTQHTRLPVFNEEINNLVGVLHLKKIVEHLTDDTLSPNILEEKIETPYFIPENNSLLETLINLRQNHQRLAMVVDEYGEIKGLVTIDDILEEIVGSFTTPDLILQKHVIKQKDGSFIVDAGINIRDLNRKIESNFPEDSAKTLSGLIIEQLDTIPTSSTSIALQEYTIEVLKVDGNMIKQVKVTKTSSV